jgi:hypothetical protein
MTQHLVLVVPGWKLSPLHASSRERLMMLCMQRGVDLSIMPEFASGIDLARNITVAKFRQLPDQKPDDVLGMIDSDLAFDPDSVFAVLAAMNTGLEVVGGLYPKKIVDFQKGAEATRAGVPTEELRYHAAQFVGGAAPGSRRAHVSADGKHRFVSADKLGTGFLFMRRDALDRFIAFHSERTEHYSHWEPKGTHHLVFFSEPMGKRQEARDSLLRCAQRHGRNRASVDELVAATHKYNRAMEGPLDSYQTEDFSFTVRANEAGISCWMYLDAQFAHQGTWVFEGNMGKALALRDKEAAE